MTQHRKRRIRPLIAYKHFKKLVADKEDTTQVFYIIEALDGSNLERDFERFIHSKNGQTRFQKRRELVAMLDDHETLRKLPIGSVGQHYCDFMEAQGLTAQGLVDEYDRFGKPLEDHYEADVAWYGNRRRDVHDLMHIMTGYSRDALGEACVLAFTQSQHRGLGIYFIAHMAAYEIRKTSPKNAPVWKAVREAKKNGALADIIIQEDIIALLAEPLDAARQRLGIQLPQHYKEAHNAMHEAGIDPFNALSAQAA